MPIRNRCTRKARYLPRFDRLEDRRLMAVGIDVFPISPIDAFSPLAATGDGGVWIASHGPAPGGTSPIQHASIDGVVTPFAPAVGLRDIQQVMVGPDDSLWVLTEVWGAPEGGSYTVVDRFDSGSRSTYRVAGNFWSTCIGHDGNLWGSSHVFDASNGHEASIVRLTPTGEQTRFPMIDANDSPSWIAAGPDGNLWFVLSSGAGGIAMITPDGTITRYPTEGRWSNWPVEGEIVATGDGQLAFPSYFPATGQSGIDRVGLDGTDTFVSVGLGHMASSVAPGEGGDLWFTDPLVGAIGRLSDDGTLSETLVPGGINRTASLISDGRGGFWTILGLMDGPNGPTSTSLAHIDVDRNDPGIEPMSGPTLHAVGGRLQSDLKLVGFSTNAAADRASDFSALIDLGGGTPGIDLAIPSAIVTRGESGNFFVTVPAGTLIQPGSRSITITIRRDSDHHAATTITIDATFDKPPPIVTASDFTDILGQDAFHTVATISDETPTSAGLYQIRIDWGDGSTDEFLGAGLGEVGRTHRYDRLGLYAVAVQVDDGWNRVTAISTATVATSPPVGIWQSQLSTQDQWGQPRYNFTEADPETVWIGSFGTDSPDSTASNFLCMIDWGDGTTSAGRVEASGDPGGGAPLPGHFSVFGGHAYTLVGPMIVHVIISTPGAFAGRSVEEMTTVVRESPLLLRPEGGRVVAGETSAVVLARFGPQSPGLALSPDDFEASINWIEPVAVGALTVVRDPEFGFALVQTVRFATTGTKFAAVLVKRRSHPGSSSAAFIPIEVAAPIGSIPTVDPTPIPEAPRSLPVVSLPVVSASQSLPVKMLLRINRGGEAILRLRYSETSDRAQVSARSRYIVIEAGKDGKLGTRDDRRVTIKSARYALATNTVTLIPKGTFSRKAKFRVAIGGDSVFAVARG